MTIINQFVYKNLFLSLSVFILALGASASEKSAEQMKHNLDFIGTVFESSYAPKDWKRHFSNWSIEQTINDLKSRISPATTVKEYQKMLAHFFYSAKDYHVGFSFVSSEKAMLPFTVKKAEEKFFVVFIDREKLPMSSFPFEVGDEIVKFDGKPTQEAVNELMNLANLNVKLTDEALATLFLTFRRGSRAQSVPKGSTQITILPKGSDSPRSFQVAWNYTPERIQNPTLDGATPPNILSRVTPSGSLDGAFPQALSRKMQFSMASDFNQEFAQNPYGLGTRNGFLPELGSVIWKNEESKFFHSYIYKNEKGNLIGYVRIASYSPEVDPHEAVQQFGEIVNHLEKNTEALVIDQLNNPGGSVFYLYALASMLTTQPLYTPQHKMTLTQGEIQETYDLLDQLNSKTTEELIKSIGGKNGTLAGYPVDYNMIQFAKNYAQFVIKEWESGKTITSPYYIFGVDQINPSRIAKYSKPILILTNELDFSGGDFFPTILQDNRRAKIMGTRTAGAGGYVLEVSYPNIFGLSGFRYTGSIAERIDKNPIENLGVTPDIDASFTPEDLQNGFTAFKRRVNNEVLELLK